MHRPAALVLISVLLLAGCQSTRLSRPAVCAACAVAATIEQSKTPAVRVVAGRLIVSPPILYFTPGDRDVLVTWTLSDEALSFAERGIEIDGALTDTAVRVQDARAVVLNDRQTEVVDCKPGKAPRTFTCLNRNTTPGVYKYTIRVQSGGGTLEVDPPMVNM